MRSCVVRRLGGVLALVVLVVLAGLPTGAALPSTTAEAVPVKAAVVVDGRTHPEVGPLFPGGDTHGVHTCTASVLASAAGNLILTAAHCLHGRVIGWAFAPGFDDGAAPYGVWRTTGAYLSPQWLHDQDPQYDYAVLTVVPSGSAGRRGRLQRITGGLSVTNPSTLRPVDVTDVAYNAGTGGRAITCRTRLGWTSGYPTFTCAGFVGGSSGSPWITGGPRGRQQVVGVTGGLHQGGCVDYVSYASMFDRDVRRLMIRATFAETPDVAPVRDPDGC